MYVPLHAREDRPEVLRAVIDELRFGTLATVRGGAPVLSQLPMMWVPGGAAGTIIGHVARANPQWADAGGGRAAAMFTGPAFYVSPSAYATKSRTGKVVPTFDYIAVEAQGTIAFFDEAERVLGIVRTLTDRFEQNQPEPWAVADAPADYLAGQLRGIVAFELTIDALAGAWKLSANRDAADRAGVAAMMERSCLAGVRALAPRVRGDAAPER